jgi:hypothetical protein
METRPETWQYRCKQIQDVEQHFNRYTTGFGFYDAEMRVAYSSAPATQTSNGAIELGRESTWNTVAQYMHRDRITRNQTLPLTSVMASSKNEYQKDVEDAAAAKRDHFLAQASVASCKRGSVGMHNNSCLKTRGDRTSLFKLRRISPINRNRSTSIQRPALLCGYIMPFP